MIRDEDVQFGDVFQPYIAQPERLKVMFVRFETSVDGTGRWWTGWDFDAEDLIPGRTGFQWRWKDPNRGVDEPFWHRVDNP